LPYYWPSQPTWTKSLFKDDEEGKDTSPVHGHRPLGHPVIANGKVYVTEGQKVRAFDLTAGTPVGNKLQTRNFDPKKTPDPICTLSAGEGRVFGRFGTPLIGNTSGKSFLSCFTPVRNAVAANEVWKLSPAVADVPGGLWEGAPLVARGRMWAALARFDGARVVHSIACFDPIDPEGTSRVVRRRLRPILSAAKDTRGPQHRVLLEFRGRGRHRRRERTAGVGVQVSACRTPARRRRSLARSRAGRRLRRPRVRRPGRRGTCLRVR